MRFIHGLKIMYTMMSMMLNQCTCFFQAVEGHANLIWSKKYTTPYHCKDPEKPRVLLLGPTGISAVNIGRTTTYSEIKPREQSYMV